jgi:hypothetical protein
VTLVDGLELGTKCVCAYSHSRCLPPVLVVPFSYLLLCIEKNYATKKARTRPKLPTAARRDINTSGIVEEGRSSPDCLDENRRPLMFLLLLLEIGHLLQRKFLWKT